MNTEHLVNQRQHFRLEDEFDFAYAPANADDSVLFAEQGGVRFNLFNQFRELEEQVQGLKEAMVRDNPPLAEYFEHLDRKFELMANVMLGTDGVPRQRISLSLGGLGFFTEQPLAKGTELKIKLVLQPKQQGFITKVKVIHCVTHRLPESQHPYRVSAKFSQLTESEERLIMGHIVHRQLEDLKKGIFTT